MNSMFLTNTLLMFLLGSVVCPHAIYAQQNEPEVRIKIQQNINGQISEIDTVISGGNADVNDLMRDFNLRLQMPGLNNTTPDEMPQEPQSGSLSDKLHKRTVPQNQNEQSNENPAAKNNEASLGIAVDTKETNDDDEGVKVASVISGSAAEKAGLQPGDLIMSINGKELFASEDLVNEVGKYKPGDEVVLIYIRNGKRTETKAILQEPQFDNFLQQQQWMGDFFNPDTWGSDPGFENWADDLDRFRRQMEEQMNRWNRQNEGLNDQWNDFDDPFKLSEPNHTPANSAETTLQPEKMSIAVDATQKTFNIRFSLSESGGAVIRILDAQGSILFEDKPARFPGAYQKEVKLKNSPFAGTYFLQIVQNGNMYNKKITVK